MIKKIVLIILLLIIFTILLNTNYKNKVPVNTPLDNGFTILSSLVHDINSDSMSDHVLITTDNDFLYLNINDTAYKLPYIDYENMKISMSSVPQLSIWTQGDKDILLIHYKLDNVLGNPITFILYYDTIIKNIGVLIDFSYMELEYTLNQISKNVYLYTILPYDLTEVVSFDNEMNARYMDGNIRRSGTVPYDYCEFVKFEDMDSDGFKEIIEYRYPIKAGWPLKEPQFKIIHDVTTEDTLSKSYIFDLTKEN